MKLICSVSFSSTRGHSIEKMPPSPPHTHTHFLPQSKQINFDLTNMACVFLNLLGICKTCKNQLVTRCYIWFKMLHPKPTRY